ncbi:hypothetical protein NDU88_005497 [Pleurodeles waltl]|uniref:Uncharacterized protein n=1 Tax=Pleurodeles waltl TaxID=8319 RepID=A0AAV7WDJ5_PLEWA|nr:hypothetical protein NDU88_005497 [Pleurodeles waltl]
MAAGGAPPQKGEEGALSRASTAAVCRAARPERDCGGSKGGAPRPPITKKTTKKTEEKRETTQLGSCLKETPAPDQTGKQTATT